MTTDKGSLNKLQRKAIKELNEWLKDENETLPITLSGYAGTGKSYTIARWIEQCPYAPNEIALCAPTHKAKNVLLQSVIDCLKDSPAFEGSPLNFPSLSLHQLLGITLVSDEESGKLKGESSQSKLKPIEKVKLAIIDECGMIDSAMFEELILYSWRCRIIFLGDILQLPPVENKPAENKEVKEESGLSLTFSQVKKVVYLKEVMRNAGMIQKVSMEFCKQIEMGGEPFSMLQAFVCAMQAEPKEGRALAHTNFEISNERLSSLENLDLSFQYLASKNKTVDEIISIARNGKTESVEEGERLMLYSPLSIKQGAQEIVIPNSSEGTVLETRSLERIYQGSLSNCGVITQAYWRLLKVNALEITIEFEGLGLLNIPFFPFREKFESELRKLAVRKQISWGRHYYPFLKQCPHLKHTYALTVHKSQGSTYDKVAIVDDFDWARKQALSLYNRLYYVAVSRGKELVKICSM